MNKKITNNLIHSVKKLKDKYKIFGLKTEFEAEGSTCLLYTSDAADDC